MVLYMCKYLHWWHIISITTSFNESILIINKIYILFCGLQEFFSILTKDFRKYSWWQRFFLFHRNMHIYIYITLSLSVNHHSLLDEGISSKFPFAFILRNSHPLTVFQVPFRQISQRISEHLLFNFIFPVQVINMFIKINILFMFFYLVQSFLFSLTDS